MKPLASATPRATPVPAQVAPARPVNRRAALLAAPAAAALLLPRVASARDAKAAAAAAAARKEALRKAAADAKSTGRDEAAFAGSEYSVSEDHSPNAHSHQDEGAKTAGGG